MGLVHSKTQTLRQDSKAGSLLVPFTAGSTLFAKAGLGDENAATDTVASPVHAVWRNDIRSMHLELDDVVGGVERLATLLIKQMAMRILAQIDFEVILIILCVIFLGVLLYLVFLANTLTKQIGFWYY